MLLFTGGTRFDPDLRGASGETECGEECYGAYQRAHGDDVSLGLLGATEAPEHVALVALDGHTALGIHPANGGR